MKKYRDKTGKSGVEEYDTGLDWIDVVFKKNEEVYRYTYKSAGQHHIEIMKDIAKKGIGLSTYISQHVHDKYEYRYDRKTRNKVFNLVS
jgi:macrodomain Ter protein organizer (MatP/YcbG family)